MNGKIIVLLLSVVSFIGCASSSGYLPKHALTDPVDAMSIPHPVELEREDVKVITAFTGILDPGLWTEIVSVGGVWPAIGMDMESGKIFKGYAYWSGLDWWGEMLIEYNFRASAAELKNCKFLYFNRDAGWAYQSSGNQVAEEKKEGKVSYDSEKFERDEKYRKELFAKFGMSLAEINLDWQNRIKRNILSDNCFSSPVMEQQCLRDSNLDLKGISTVWEIKIGTKDWEKYKEKVILSFPHEITMPNGEIRLSFLTEEEFKPEAIRNPKFTGTQRYLKNSVIPLSLLAMSGPALPWMAAANVASSAAVAAVDDSWAGYYDRAKILRHDLADNFRQLSSLYKKQIVQRNHMINYLRYILDKNHIQY